MEPDKINAIAKHVSDGCVAFAKQINAVRLSGRLVAVHVVQEVRKYEEEKLDPYVLYSKVEFFINEEGITLK